MTGLNRREARVSPRHGPARPRSRLLPPEPPRQFQDREAGGADDAGPDPDAGRDGLGPEPEPEPYDLERFRSFRFLFSASACFLFFLTEGFS